MYSYCARCWVQLILLHNCFACVVSVAAIAEREDTRGRPPSDDEPEPDDDDDDYKDKRTI